MRIYYFDNFGTSGLHTMINNLRVPANWLCVYVYSTGVGRTGTLITIQSMMKMIEHENKVDIFNFVLNMRHQRNLMVQTEVSTSTAYVSYGPQKGKEIWNSSTYPITCNIWRYRDLPHVTKYPKKIILFTMKKPVNAYFVVIWRIIIGQEKCTGMGNAGFSCGHLTNL